MRAAIIRATKRALSLCLAFIIFGFLDNAIMLISGDLIDKTLAVSLGVSTLFAAGLGNTISDALGISVGRVVEQYFEEHLPKGNPSRSVIILSETMGIILGCLCGLAPLAFL